MKGIEFLEEYNIENETIYSKAEETRRLSDLLDAFVSEQAKDSDTGKVNLPIKLVSNIEERKTVCPNCYDNKVIMHKEHDKETCVKCGFQWQTDC